MAPEFADISARISGPSPFSSLIFVGGCLATYQHFFAFACDRPVARGCSRASCVQVRQRQGGGVFAVKKIPLVSSAPRRRHQEGERLPGGLGTGILLTGGAGLGAPDMRLKRGCVLSALGGRKKAGEERGPSSVLGDLMARGGVRGGGGGLRRGGGQD